ncbi:MAG: cysteine rich repeat-containing protein [Gammaproteobacteria bacterium]
MKIIGIVSSLILAAALFSNPAFAEGKKLAEKLSKGVIGIEVQVESCDSDADIFCPGLPLDSRKSFMCLMAYENNLSIACKLGIVEAALAIEDSVNAINYSIKSCEADADKLCLKVKPGEGRIVNCLRKNESKLDKKCTAALKETGLWDLGKK